MQSGKINDKHLRKRVIKAIQEAGQPVSIEYVAQSIKLAWTTARAILLDLSLNQQIVAVKTTRGYVFTEKKDTGA